MNEFEQIIKPDYVTFAKEFGYKVDQTKTKDLTEYYLATGEGSPLVIRANVLNNKPFWSSVWAFIRTTSWQFDGDRSDLHDIISSVLAMVLRDGGISVSMHTIDHPVLDEPAGIYGRLLTFERHNLMEFEPTDINVETVNKVLVSSMMAGFLLTVGMSFGQEKIHRVDRSFGYDWATKIAQFLYEDVEDLDLHNIMARTNPLWKWFHSLFSGISVFFIDNPKFLSALKASASNEITNVAQGPSRMIIRHKDLLNAVSIKRYRLAESLIKYLEGDNSDTAIIPIEDRFFFIGEHNIVAVQDDCGPRSVNQEREEIRERQQLEREVLFPPTAFVWAGNIDDSRFEALVGDLLRVEPGVIRVRHVSVTNEPDGGRDLEAEWYLFNKSNNIQSPKESPYKLENVLIQCKAYSRSVGKNNVQDIRDTVDKYNARGYLLVVSSSLTTPLFDYLTMLRNRGAIWVDWWTRYEIEDRLRKNPDIAERYYDILKPK